MRRSPWLVLPVAWMAVLYTLSALPGPRVPAIAPFPHADKLAHAGVYLALLLSFLPAAGLRRPLHRWLPHAAVSSFLFALTDEFHQAFVPGRVPDIGDLFADAVGIACGCFVCVAVWRLSRRRTASP